MCQSSVNVMPCCIKHASRPFGTEVLRLDMCRSILSLSKVVHQMWHDHPFSQRNRKTEWTMGVEDGGDREVLVKISQ